MTGTWPTSYEVVMLNEDGSIKGLINNVRKADKERLSDDVDVINKKREEEALTVMHEWHDRYFKYRPNVRIAVVKGKTTY